MGQATADLPNSMEPPPAGAGGTDELLAQLAGEEIDRLLAEADAERAAVQSAKDPPQAPNTPQASPAEAVPAPLSVAADVADAELSAQLDNLFADLTANAPLAPAADVPSPAPVSSPRPAPEKTARATAAAVASTAPPAAAEPAPSSAAEPLHPVEQELREAEALQQGPRPTAPSPTDDATFAALADEDAAPLPLFLRPLEWISAPLNACPESVRDLVGKVAILTTVNALSVLVYVFFFRKH